MVLLVHLVIKKCLELIDVQSTFKPCGDRFSMSGLMHLLDMSQLLHATLLIGRNGGKILKMWSCFSSWEKIIYHFIL